MPSRGVYERVLDVRPVWGRLHVVHNVAEHETVPFQEVLKRAQTHVVEIGVDAAEAVHVEVSHGVDSINVPTEALVELEEPGVLLGHEALIVRVRPEQVLPFRLREALSPSARPVSKSSRQVFALPALVNDSHQRPVFVVFNAITFQRLIPIDVIYF